MIFALARYGFMIWGIYKGGWVFRKIWKWLTQKCAERRAENEFVRQLAMEIRLDREA